MGWSTKRNRFDALAARLAQAERVVQAATLDDADGLLPIQGRTWQAVQVLAAPDSDEQPEAAE